MEDKIIHGHQHTIPVSIKLNKGEWPKFMVWIHRMPKVIFNVRQGMTIVKFPDGETVISKCTSDNDFDPEVGVAMCLAKKHYTRGEIKRMVDSGQYFEERNPK